MVALPSQIGEINVLATQTDWPWHEALSRIFQPVGANLLMASSFSNFVDIAQRKKIHAAILDTEWSDANVFATIRIIRTQDPRLPLILFSLAAEQTLLDQALSFDVFSVIEKPVEVEILKKQLNRLFIRKYNLKIFESLIGTK